MDDDKFETREYRMMRRAFRSAFIDVVKLGLETLFEGSRIEDQKEVQGMIDTFSEKIKDRGWQ